MASNNQKRSNRQILDQFKTEAVQETGVDLTNPDLRSRDAGSVGGTMVKNMLAKITNGETNS